MGVLLAALIWFPGFDARLAAAHDLGVEEHLRGAIELNIDIKLLRDPRWRLDLFSGIETFVRSNRRQEGLVRISPEQLRFPVGIRMRFPLEGTREWGLFARHQSNHDIDSIDAALAKETISYEVYGVDWKTTEFKAEAGVYYDRGTRLSGKHQVWPFDYYLGGIGLSLNKSLSPRFYMTARTLFVAHRNAHHDIPYTNVDGHIEAGYQVFGLRGRWRTLSASRRCSCRRRSRTWRSACRRWQLRCWCGGRDERRAAGDVANCCGKGQRLPRLPQSPA